MSHDSDVAARVPFDFLRPGPGKAAGRFDQVFRLHDQAI
jgi:hypothetical protein